MRPLEAQVLQFLQVSDLLRVLLDDHEGPLVLLQDLADFLADAAEPADDVVLFQSADLSMHFSPLVETAQLAFDHGLGDLAEHIEHEADARDDEEHGEDPPGIVHRHDVAVAHGEHGDDGQVQSHPETGVLEQHVAEGADEQQGDEDDADNDDFAHFSLAESGAARLVRTRPV